MLKAITLEMLENIVLCVIILAGAYFCSLDNTARTDEIRFQNWEYNTEFTLPAGWIIAATHGGKR